MDKLLLKMIVWKNTEKFCPQNLQPIFFCPESTKTNVLDVMTYFYSVIYGYYA